MISIYIVAPNQIFIDSLTELIGKNQGLRLLGAGEFAAGVVDRVSASNPDIVVLIPAWHDAQFAGTRAIHQGSPRSKILMIGMEDDLEVFLRAVRAGAVGYLLKEASSEQIVKSISQLASESFLCPRHMLRALFDFASQFPEPTPPASANNGHELTHRESELIALVAQGLTNKEIASRLNLSEHTVKNHVHSILRKTGARTRVGLTHQHSRERF
jgi:two-component system response regulator DevR